MPVQTEVSIQSQIADAICSATDEVFSVMLGMQTVAGAPQMGKTAQDLSGVAAVLGLTGEEWTGSGEFSCESTLACRVASALLMEEYTEVNDDVLDAVAEVANMVIGNVKNKIEQELGPMGMSTPAVVFGADFETRVFQAPEAVVVPFMCAGVSMTVQLVLRPRRKLRRA